MSAAWSVVGGRRFAAGGCRSGIAVRAEGPGAVGDTGVVR